MAMSGSVPPDDRAPMTEEQLRAVTIGELTPLTGRIRIEAILQRARTRSGERQ